MRRFSIASFVLLLCGVLCAAISASCRGGSATGPRVIVLGFDGLDYQLTRTLMEAGRLPNFSRLAKMGGFSPLGTSMPPQSPVAWSSFTTGLDPADHGIYDFIHRDPATMTPYLSTTRTEAAGWTVPIGPWEFPLKGGSVTPLRAGEPFWTRLESAGARTSILRMPANYPPSGEASHELSGMGTPDILGTYGTFSFYTSEPFAYAGRTIAGGVIHRVRAIEDRVEAALEGPDNPFRRERVKVTAPFTAYIDPREPAARIILGVEQRVLAVGEWSDWVPITFALTPMQSLRGMCRLYLKQVRPYFELYVTPINLDPLSPALPISTPSSYAAELAGANGRFYTQGMPEDTKAYSAGVFNAEEFLRQAGHTAEESRRQYAYVLDRFAGGAKGGSGERLLFYYFGHVDQVSHMMWRAMDPGHPAYNAATDAPHRHVVEDLYVGLDRIVGQTLDRMTPDMMLVIMSDHGFTSWRRTFHLNSWLEQNGYLTVMDPARRAEPMFGNVDWSKTRAYGLGLNGLYLNLAGREKSGIVPAARREALRAEIEAKLLAAIDPSTGQRAITAIARPEGAGSHAVAHPDRAPDLLVGYAKGTRGSNESALGEVPAEVMIDNREAWSGDHCMDPAAVPGVLFVSRPLPRAVTSLRDLTGAILAEFGVTPAGSEAAGKD
jgi:predicted AlkP superfamily phosphohydrolase/phosphomutase